MGRKRIEMTGLRFGRLVVLHYMSDRMWMCLCDCGTKHITHGGNLRCGDVTSCGCYFKEVKTIHGDAANETRTSEYNAWQNMLARCENKNHPEYKNYGNRGISVCERWHTFENFLADMGRKPSSDLSIERRNNDGNYEKDNCYWASRSAQARNKRPPKRKLYTLNGVSKTAPEWAAVWSMSTMAAYKKITREKAHGA